MPESPSATVVIPTRGRARYLDGALASIVPQARDAQAEVVVVEDGAHATREVADRHGVRHLSLGASRGINSARNAGVAAARGPLVVFCDDDVRAAPGWLAALLDAAGALPDVGVFGGPIIPAIDGGGPRSCGREGPVISALDLGARDRDCEFVWGANMAVRGSTLDLVGAFDVALDAVGCGDEEDWERRYHRLGGRVRYVAGARVEHLRMRADARMTALARAAFRRGRAARAYDRYKGTAPTAAAELRTLAGCVGHTLRYRCQNGLLLCAHAGGRVADTVGGGTARTRRVRLVVREASVLPRLPAPVAAFYVRSWIAATRSGDRFTLDSATRPSDVAVLIDVARGQRQVVELGTGTAWTTIALALADHRRTVVSCDPVVRAERERYLRLAGRQARRVSSCAPSLRRRRGRRPAT